MSNVLSRQAAPQWLQRLRKYQQKKWKPTKLSIMDEQKFKGWLSGLRWYKDIKGQVAAENNILPKEVQDDRLIEMLAGKGSEYDYRGAWKAGVRPKPDKFDGNRIHWPSSAGDKNLKSPQHSTAWKEFFMRENNINPDELGLNDVESALEWQRSK